MHQQELPITAVSFCGRIGFFAVSVRDDVRKVARLERMNAELKASLKRCRVMLAECQARLAANSNDKPLFRWKERAEGRANTPPCEPYGES